MYICMFYWLCRSCAHVDMNIWWDCMYVHMYYRLSWTYAHVDKYICWGCMHEVINFIRKLSINHLPVCRTHCPSYVLGKMRGPSEQNVFEQKMMAHRKMSNKKKSRDNLANVFFTNFRQIRSSESKFLWVKPGLPDFSGHNIPKRGEVYQISTKLPNGD
jgi:hypothetical protein